MLDWLPRPILGTLTLLVLCINTAFVFCLLFPFMLLKLLTPIPVVRQVLTKYFIVPISSLFIHLNSGFINLTQNITWDVQGLGGLSIDKSYLVISNHRSWTDIFILQHVFNGQTPFIRFFLKQELIWVPLLGIAWWALDYPFLKRYSKKTLKKHPELKGKDFETTRMQCAKFKDSPVAVMNFIEGTRFTEEKHLEQQSQYEHLLKPKVGGVALVLSSMGDYLSEALDITIAYPENDRPINFMEFLAGEVPQITVRVRKRPLPQNVMGRDYEKDQSYREEVRAWINTIWSEKDLELHAILGNECAVNEENKDITTPTLM